MRQVDALATRAPARLPPAVAVAGRKRRAALAAALVLTAVYLAAPAELGGGGGSSGGGGGGGAAAAAAGGRGALVLKTPRFLTKNVRESFAAECASLATLTAAADLGLVPALVACGCRAPDWPVLLLTPCGEPLATWVAGCAAAAAAAAPGPATRSSAAALASAASARRACARAVALRMLAALEAAHAAGIIHCDVRPSNVVVAAGGAALLVDWGSSCACGTEVRGRGVARLR